MINKDMFKYLVVVRINFTVVFGLLLTVVGAGWKSWVWVEVVGSNNNNNNTHC